MLVALDSIVQSEGWSVDADPELDRLFLSFRAPEFRWHASWTGDVSVEMTAALLLAILEHCPALAEAVAARLQARLPRHE